MGDNENISSVIKKISKSSDEVYAKVCKVIDVNTTDNTVDVKPVDETAEIFDVRLQADTENKGLVLIPKIGSMVVVVFLNKDNAVVANTSELDKITMNIATCTLQIDGQGFLLKKQNETLKKLMSDLLSAIKQMSFALTTPDTINGTTTTLLNAAAFSSIETRFNQFLK